MTKQQLAVLNMAKFIRSQSLLLLEKIEALDLDDEAQECEQLHDQAEKVFKRLSERLENSEE